MYQSVALVSLRVPIYVESKLTLVAVSGISFVVSASADTTAHIPSISTSVRMKAITNFFILVFCPFVMFIVFIFFIFAPGLIGGKSKPSYPPPKLIIFTVCISGKSRAVKPQLSV